MRAPRRVAGEGATPCGGGWALAGARGGARGLVGARAREGVLPSGPVASTPRSGLLQGSRAALRGLRFAAAHPEVRAIYRRLMLLIFVMSLILSAGLLVLLWHFTPIAPEAAIWEWLGLWLLRIAGALVILFAAPILALTGINAIFPILAERTFFAALEVLAPARAQALAGGEGLGFTAGLRISLRRLLHFLGVTVVCFAITLIPVIGAVLGPILQISATARALTWELLDPYFDRRRMGYAEQRAYLRAQRGAIVGFGAPLSLLLGLPLLGPLFFGLAQGGVAVLVADVLEPEA